MDHGNSSEQPWRGMGKARSTERITSSMAGFILMELASTAQTRCSVDFTYRQL
jgi:hypothetical protein